MIRKIISVIVAMAICLPMVHIVVWAADSGVATVVLAAAADFESGDGGPDNPYRIASAEQFKLLADNVNGGSDYEGKYFELTEDIDLGGSEGNQWTPIGSGGTYFKGTFDGGGHKITGLYINKPDDNYQALFRNVVVGVVKNLGVEGSVTALNNVGGIAASISARSTIDGCYSNVRIISTREDSVSTSGGIAGTVWNGCVIKNCYNIGDVSGSADRIGGIVGFNYAGEIQNCYNTGTVQGSTELGGIVGYSYYGAKVQNCYNIGLVESVDGDGSVGSIAGKNDSSTSTVQNCFFLSGTLDGVGGGSGTNTNVTGIDTAAFALQTTFDAYWDFDTVWKMSSLHGRPVLIAVTEEAPKLKGGGDSEEDPYLINTAEDLVLLAKLVNGGETFWGKYIKLTDDIDLSSVCGKDIGSWTPIGVGGNVSVAKPFGGTFDGGGHLISGLYIDKSFKYEDRLAGGVGLFACISGATIKNLGVDGNISVDIRYVCGIVGEAEGANIIVNCYYTGDVSENDRVGGIVGENESDRAVVQNCYYLKSDTVNSTLNGVGSSDDPDTVKGVANKDFTSGEVAWLLQNGQDEQVWGQKLTGEDKDDYPVLTNDESIKVIIFPLECTDSEGNELTIYTNPPATVALR